MADSITVANLELGDTIYLLESSGSYGSYTLVQFDYNDGVALLWRDSGVGKVQWHNSSMTSDTTTYYECYLDMYLEASWYISLPQETKDLLVKTSYPIATSMSDLSQKYISRYVSTVSAAEIGGNAGSNLYGTTLDYYQRVSDDDLNYWTRQHGSSASAARFVDNTGAFANAVVTLDFNVRPTVGVAQASTIATYDSTLGGYTLSPGVTLEAPPILYFGSSQQDFGNFQPGTGMTLKWDVPTSGTVEYYLIYTSCSDGTGSFSNQLTTNETIGWAPSKGYQTNTFTLYTKFAEDAEKLYVTPVQRKLSTKNTNVWVYAASSWDETYFKWFLANVKYYDGNQWIDTGGMNYYDESGTWHIAGESS